MKMKKTIVVILIASLVLMTVPAAESKVYKKPYDQSEHVVNKIVGGAAGKVRYDRAQGKIESYLITGVIGEGDTTIRMGNTHVVNSGDLLDKYSDMSRASVYTRGHLSCLGIDFSLGENAALSVELQKWRRSGVTWVLEERSPMDTDDCTAITTIDETKHLGSTFTYNAGQTYRLMVAVNSKVKIVGVGEAAVDFCTDANWWELCSTNNFPEWIIVNEISVPNQNPRVRAYENQKDWYVLASLLGATTDGRGCDFDGSSTSVRVAVNGFSSTSGTGSACRTTTHTWKPLAPGFYGFTVTATDNEGASASDTDSHEITVIPTATAVTGFPNLATIPESSLGTRVTIETLVNAAGEVRAYRVSSGAVVHMDTLTGVVPAPTDAFAVTEYDRLLSTASIQLDTGDEWSGAVLKHGANWWEIRPVGALPGESTPYVLAPAATFDVLDTAPVVDSVPLSAEAEFGDVERYEQEP